MNFKSRKNAIIEPQFPRCVILAAGTSTRLRPLSDLTPKCLLEINGKKLLEQIIENVVETGVTEIGIVIGYQGAKIREFVTERFPLQRIRFILNPNYAATNNAYSLLLARRFLANKDGKIMNNLLLLDCDILFPRRLLPFLLNDGIKNTIAVRVSGEHNEEEIRVKIDDNKNIIKIGKDIPLTETYGESIGIEILSVETASQLFAILEQRVRTGKGRNEFYEAAFQKMIDIGTKLKAVDISAFPSIEIDTLEDFNQAKQLNIV